MKRSTPPTGRSTAQWLRTVEDASLARRHAEAVDAAARFDALASPAQRMALVREIVATRAAEMTLAYRNVVMVSAGYKAREDAQGRQQVHPEPCVIFVVKRKWRAGRAGPAVQRLPARLLTYGGDGERQLYAVPTDVQPASGFIGAGARADGCVRLDDADPPFRLPGTLSCAVRAVGAGPAGRRLVLSAMHVLNPVPPHALPKGGVAFTDIGAGGLRRGQSSTWGGHVDGNTGSAFDVQLAEGVDPGWFNAAYQGWALSKTRPYVKTLTEFDELAATMRFQIVAPDNHPQAPRRPREAMLAQFTAMVHEELPLEYQVRQGGGFSRVLLHHRTLVKLEVARDCPVPLSGDSGSAVLTWWPDGSNVFVGVFIASPDSPGFERVAYVIPAWEVFDTRRWSALPPGTTALVPGFQLR